MDIASLGVAAAAARGSPRVKAHAGADPAEQALQRADSRIQKQRDATSVEVSAFGKLKSSFSQVRGAAAALADPKQTATTADVTKVATGFVKAYNSAVKTASAATAPKAPLADNSRARAAESDLRRSVNADSVTKADLKKIGITQQNDGTLALDAKKFDAALQANPTALRETLATLGQQVGQGAGRELANNGNIGKSVSTLESRARNLEDRQVEQQALAAAAQQTISTQTASINKNLNNLNTGAAAYQRIFSL